MSVKAVVGGNWGDEGKGKITDLLAADADLIVRFQGGNNAGHTIVNQYGKFKLHLLPSGVFYSEKLNILSTSVALNIEVFLQEYNDLISQGVPAPKILISDRAQILLPHHILLDEYEEERLGDEKFGSTLSGIAPFYSDKYSKIGIQVSDIFDDDRLLTKINKNIEKKNILLDQFYHKPTLNEDKIFNHLCSLRKNIKPYLANTSLLINQAIRDGRSILLEGQLGALRDPDHGIYPMTTSSSPLSSFAATSIGIASREIHEVITVVKAYSSCVGAGPFVTEIFGTEAEQLRITGNEFGAKTGRPRRVGYFDAVASRYGCMLQGTTAVALSLMDVLGYMTEIPLCIAYDIDNGITEEFASTDSLYRAKPVLKYLKGWNCDISKIRNYFELPQETKDYIEFIENALKLPVKYISVGPEREDIIYKI